MPAFSKIATLPPTKHARHERKYLQCGDINPSWKPHKSGRSGKRLPKPDTKFFVAWDGEGINTGATIPYAVSERRIVNGRLVNVDTEREADEHIMTLLACSDGKTAYHLMHENNQRLTSLELLEFIGECVKRYGPNAIHVSFFFTYDASHILRDIPRDEVRKAYTSVRKKLGHYCRYGPYLIKYIPRKQLYIAKLRDEEKPYIKQPNGKYKIDTEWRVTIWDVHGFFQGSFQKALQEWGAGTPDQRAIIQRGKAERDTFHTWSRDEIIAYNDTENILLVELMNRVKAALGGMSVKLSRWDGAGKIAGAMLKNGLPKDYIKNIPVSEEIDEIGHYAFAGGRIECVKQGTHNGMVYRYDINSAYPAAMTKIPDLHNGEWRRWDGQPSYKDFALYHISWKHDVPERDQLPFYPFFWRDVRGYIFFPSFGENWVWGCELNAAIESSLPLDITVYGGWEYIPASDDKPFAFIENYYHRRADIKQRIKADKASADDAGISLAIKLGLNSMYGKTAQKVGYDRETNMRPPYYNVLIAGWITAYTRATLFRAVWNVRDDIIAFATDGIFSTAPITSISDSSALGGWEAETLTGLQIVQSGVYWTRDSNGKWKEYSRGFDKSDEANTRRKRVADAWKSGAQFLPFTLRRFIASKYASLTDDRWCIHCAWLEENRELNVNDPGEKRFAAGNGKRQLHKRLYATLPNHSVIVNYQEIVLSQPCRTPWDDDNASGIAQEEDEETLLTD